MDVLIFYIISPNLLPFQKHSLSMKEPILECNRLLPNHAIQKFSIYSGFPAVNAFSPFSAQRLLMWAN